jgi:hypothetical protein
VIRTQDSTKLRVDPRDVVTGSPNRFRLAFSKPFNVNRMVFSDPTGALARLVPFHSGNTIHYFRPVGRGHK